MGIGPGGLDCGEVLADVFVYLDNETAQDARERIREHLEGCEPCLREFGVERDLKELIGRCCGGDVAPDSLRRRLKLRLEQVVVASGADGLMVAARVVEASQFETSQFEAPPGPASNGGERAP
jgi:mycothiol system anti-sigma-R factor